MDLISREDAIRWVKTECNPYGKPTLDFESGKKVIEHLEQMPSAQPEPRSTEEELRVFQHGISLSLLSKRSSQHWQYDEDTATEIKSLERLYEKVGADMRGEQDE